MDKFLILHLSLIDGVGAAAIQKIIDLQRSDVTASDLYLFSVTDFMHLFGFTINLAQKIVNGLSDKKILERELALIMCNNVQWTTILDENYPSLLREIYLPPAVLYWFGDTFYNTQKSIAFVGSRKADNYGYRVVKALIPDLVASGYAIISGGALGIDTAAHETALYNGGKTIAVLGSGLLHLYPSENKSLFHSIIDKGGLVISAFALSTEPNPGNFPARNRIITGLSRGCVVVQAAKKSGALISANYAMEQGREVFAVPGLFDDELSIGCNLLIQNGAKLITSSADILNEFGDRLILADTQMIAQQAQQLSIKTSEIDTKAKVVMQSSSEMPNQFLAPQSECNKDWGHKSSPVQQLIINACKNSVSIDDIIESSQLSFDQVQAALFDLQIEGILSQDFAGMWKVISSI